MAQAKKTDGDRRPNPVDIYVGDRVRRRRKQLGVSQERLADALGLTFQQVQKYERGANRISASKLYETSGFLGVPVSFFFEGLADPAAGPGVAEGQAPFLQDLVMDKDAEDLLGAFSQLGRKRMKRRIIELVREIAGEETSAAAAE